MVEEIILIVLKWAIPIVLGGVAGFAVGLLKRVWKRERATEDGVCALLRCDLIREHDHYMARGEYPVYARENIEAMYNAYHALGGNGTITALVKEMDKLPTDASLADEVTRA